MPLILCIIVLYKLSCEESASFRNLEGVLQRNQGLADCFRILLVDNSPVPHTPPASFVGTYLHDGANPGLAERYNYALRCAEAEGIPWLMLLDQDTKVTEEYLQEAVASCKALCAKPEVAALAPKLFQHGVMQSPHRTLYRRMEFDLNETTTGILPGLIRLYNSGAIVRCSAARSVKGFPLEYGLDYLDHAMFHRLQAAGGRISLMSSRLEHEMSIYDPERYRQSTHAFRHRGQLTAARRFYREHGTLNEQILSRLDLLRNALRPIKSGHLGDAARMIASAFTFGR